jgi:hypothetical protein
MNESNPQKFTAKVRVMRSYDYNHFEVELGSEEPMTLDQANDLRKQAAILVDEAVRQYKLAKNFESKRETVDWQVKREYEELLRIKAKPEAEWTAEEAARVVRAHSSEWWKNFDEDAYCYVDQADRDFHFSMLDRFKKTRVLA